MSALAVELAHERQCEARRKRIDVEQFDQPRAVARVAALQHREPQRGSERGRVRTLLERRPCDAIEGKPVPARATALAPSSAPALLSQLEHPDVELRAAAIESALLLHLPGAWRAACQAVWAPERAAMRAKLPTAAATTLRYMSIHRSAHD